MTASGYHQQRIYKLNNSKQGSNAICIPFSYEEEAFRYHISHSVGHVGSDGKYNKLTAHLKASTCRMKRGKSIIITTYWHLVDYRLFHSEIAIVVEMFVLSEHFPREESIKIWSSRGIKQGSTFVCIHLTKLANCRIVVDPNEGELSCIFGVIETEVPCFLLQRILKGIFVEVLYLQWRGTERKVQLARCAGEGNLPDRRYLKPSPHLKVVNLPMRKRKIPKLHARHVGHALA